MQHIGVIYTRLVPTTILEGCDNAINYCTIYGLLDWPRNANQLAAPHREERGMALSTIDVIFDNKIQEYQQSGSK